MPTPMAIHAKVETRIASPSAGEVAIPTAAIKQTKIHWVEIAVREGCAFGGMHRTVLLCTSARLRMAK